MRIKAFAEPIVRDPRRHVMQVVIADVGAEPPQQNWQIIVGTTLDSRPFEIPGTPIRPVTALKLVLHVEQPNASRATEEYHWHVHQQHDFPAESQ